MRYRIDIDSLLSADWRWWRRGGAEGDRGAVGSWTGGRVDHPGVRRQILFVVIPKNSWTHFWLRVPYNIQNSDFTSWYVTKQRLSGCTGVRPPCVVRNVWQQWHCGSGCSDVVSRFDYFVCCGVAAGSVFNILLIPVRNLEVVSWLNHRFWRTTDLT